MDVYSIAGRGESMHISASNTAARIVRLAELCSNAVKIAAGRVIEFDGKCATRSTSRRRSIGSSKADKVSRDGISRLFREEQDVRQLIKHKNVYEYLENAIDKCQDVANIIEAVVVENV
jgi:hypothetical protein